MEIRLAQMNILAPLWLTNEYKSLPCYEYFSSPDRLDVSLKHLGKTVADIYCLCEVEETEIYRIADQLECSSYAFSSNRKGFWQEYQGDKKWVKNGTCIATTGIIIDAENIDFDDGCTACIALVRVRYIDIIVVSVHFDTENRKWDEARQLIYFLRNMKGPVVIAGDFNFVDISMFRNDGYTDNLPVEVMNKSNVLTYGSISVDTKYLNSQRNTTPLPQGAIDHTLVKGCKLESVILSINRKCCGSLVDKSICKVCATVKKNGSDHFATVSDILI